jgi:Carboxypeptidase regulatory-like domain/TonB-dependent Receptor Plug Domain
MASRNSGPSGGRRLACAIGLFALSLGHSLQVEAQGAGSANLRGTVSDPSGGAVPEATLTLSNQRTRAVRSATTDAQGHYALATLVPGPYRLAVEARGFRRFESGDIHLSPGDNSSLDARLAVGGKTEEVTVTAGRDLLRTDSGARESLITSEQIQNLSIVSRSAMELLRILPGAVTPSGGQLETASFGGGPNNLNDTSVNGTRGTTISPVLDGSKIVDIGSSSGLMISMNADMVEEVKVQTSNYAAEYGSAGVQVTAVTKSGSATFHGSAYDYWRNWRLAANDRSNTNHLVPRPKSDYQYPGFNLSGPVLVPGTNLNHDHDKLFFFVGYEYQHQVTDRGTTLGVVPTLKQREGDFSELLGGAGQNLAQPSLVTIPAGFLGAGEGAPNNDLSPYIDPIGRGLLNMYPKPNFSDPDNRYNYAFNTPEPLNRWQLVTRLDWNASEKTHAYVRLALEKEKNEWARGIWGGWSNFELPEKVIGDNTSRSIALDITSVLSTSLTNELMFSASQLKLDNNWRDPSRMTLAAQGLDGYRGSFDTGNAYASLAAYSLGPVPRRFRGSGRNANLRAQREHLGRRQSDEGIPRSHSQGRPLRRARSEATELPE